MTLFRVEVPRGKPSGTLLRRGVENVKSKTITCIFPSVLGNINAFARNKQK